MTASIMDHIKEGRVKITIEHVDNNGWPIPNSDKITRAWDTVTFARLQTNTIVNLGLAEAMNRMQRYITEPVLPDRIKEAMDRVGELP